MKFGFYLEKGWTSLFSFLKWLCLKAVLKAFKFCKFSMVGQDVWREGGDWVEQLDGTVDDNGIVSSFVLCHAHMAVDRRPHYLGFILLGVTGTCDAEEVETKHMGMWRWMVALGSSAEAEAEVSFQLPSSNLFIPTSQHSYLCSSQPGEKSSILISCPRKYQTMLCSLLTALALLFYVSS